MSARRGRKLTVTGIVIPPGTIKSRSPGQLTAEERRRSALVALGELVLTLRQVEAGPESARPTVDV